MRKYIVLLGSFFVSIFCFGQKLSIELDLSNAKKTIELFKGTAPSEDQVNELIQLESSKGLLRKLEAKDTLMIQAITKALNGGSTLTRTEKRFQYNTIKQNLNDLSHFIDRLENGLSEIEVRLTQFLGSYIPIGKDLKIRIMGIAGGNSTGYTFGDAATFYISLHHMKNDLDYFLFICKHELFHNLQALWYDHEKVVNILEKSQENSSDFAIYYMLLSLYSEGTATYLDDIDNLKPREANKIWIDFQKRNKKREKSIFWLFDKTIINLQKDFSNTSLNLAYGTFFLTKYDQQGYYLGGLITDYLLEKQPEKSLQDYMRVSPLMLISDYIKLSKNDSEAPYHFSKEFETIVNQLHHKVDGLLKN